METHHFYHLKQQRWKSIPFPVIHTPWNLVYSHRQPMSCVYEAFGHNDWRGPQGMVFIHPWTSTKNQLKKLQRFYNYHALLTWLRAASGIWGLSSLISTAWDSYQGIHAFSSPPSNDRTWPWVLFSISTLSPQFLHLKWPFNLLHTCLCGFVLYRTRWPHWWQFKNTMQRTALLRNSWGWILNDPGGAGGGYQAGP